MYVPLDDERERRRAQEFVGERLPQQPQPQQPAPNLRYQPPEQPQPVPQQAQPIPDPIPQQAPAPAPQPAPQPHAQPAPQPDPQPQAPAQPPSKDDIIAQVLSIIPDVQPEHLSGLVDRNIAQFGERTSELVIGMLFEDAAYPKVERRGVKRGGDEEKGKEKEREEKRQKVDYKSLDRDVPGGGYEGLALATLQLYFAHIPRLYLHDQLQAHRGLYAPTYLALLAAEKRYETQPRLKKPYEKGIYKPKKQAKGKGKTKAGARNAAPVYGHAHVHYEVAIPESDEEGEKAVVDAGEGAEGGEGEAEIECGCCYCEYPFSQMVQCPEAHLFCKGCLTTYASNQLSSLSCVINCMSSSPACALPFPASELRRALPENLLKLYDRVTQQDEIAKAGLEGLEECPFCEWKCVMEVSIEQDKLFRCGNEDGGCGVTSCRMCKKLDHLPKSCQEVEEDKVLDGRHAIEEAMTAALMRNCPNCKKAFIKEQGCNKMTCPHCRTLSCYICRQVIKGYDHFNQMPNQPGPSRKSGKCSLWDKVEERHAEEVKAAHDKAMEKYREEHPDVETDALKVDLPPAPLHHLKHRYCLPSITSPSVGVVAGAEGQQERCSRRILGWSTHKFPTLFNHLSSHPLRDDVDDVDKVS
ncbi:hypothetical protein BJ165DRAFT_1337360 [Panaeolus papilionaceus]|nr:hypothetical protein BJ165DRAFT_1337360 [Panaeolus papilionaceus]